MTPIATASSPSSEGLSEGLSAGRAAGRAASTGLNMLHLPEEVQKEIFRQCPNSDLVVLSVVCKQFRELAAARLYRRCHWTFPETDDLRMEPAFDVLASALETFATSDYDYAKHMRAFQLDTLSSGEKAEMICKPYLYTNSCGKYLNTLMLLMLRKAKSLDTFKWNVRIELSRSVFKALHQIPTLKRLRVRLQHGPSLHENPRPLPLQQHPTGTTSASPQWPISITPGPMDLPLAGPPALLPLGHQVMYMSSLDPSQLLPGPGTFSTPSAPSYLNLPGFGAHASAPKPDPCSPKRKPLRKPSTVNKPPRLGGFKDLEVLSVLDMDEMDNLEGLSQCIHNSFSTLRKLELSFSDSLAMLARKPSLEVSAPANESDDDDDDDDDYSQIPDPPSYEDGTGPAKAHLAQQERLLQELVLGLILDVQPFPVKKGPAVDKGKKTEGRTKSADPAENFVNCIKEIGKRLTCDAHGISYLHGSAFFTQSQKETLEVLEKAARKYVEARATKRAAAAAAAAAADPPVEAVASSSKTAADAMVEDAAHESGGGLFDQVPTKPRADKNEPRPEDIDVSAPDDDPEDAFGTESVDESPDDLASASEAKVGAEPSSSRPAMEAATANDDGSITPTTNMTSPAACHDLHDNEESDHVNQSSPSDGQEDLKRQVADYARGSRGIALRSLAVHLIPVKASVLSRAIDVRTLQRITLLNTGNQCPIWTLLSKENKMQALPLRKIFTDHVSPIFLQFLSQLECVEELFLVERGLKYKPESFAPKNKVSLDQIRRHALKKHMPTMKRLLIKNDADSSWDTDEKTMQLICRKGLVLEELAVVMGIRSIHVFMQYMASLVRLRALHITTFRTEDTCHSVIRETRKFIVDTVAHCPELQLEYLCMGGEERAQRITRNVSTKSESKTKVMNKGKGKAVMGGMNVASISFPLIQPDGLAMDFANESDGDDEPPLQVELVEDIRFQDIPGVRIFRKDVMHARL